MGISDVWDFIVDGFDYLIHFEWFGDIKDAIVETFESIGEFSTYGLIFGVIGVAFIFLTKQWMLDSFTKLMNPAKGLFITILTFILTFVAGYFVGKRFQDTA